jgi:hypothetical protein
VAKKKKTAKIPEVPAASTEQVPAVGRGPAAGAGSQEPAIDAPREEAHEEEPANSTVAGSSAAPEFVTVAFPLPAGIPHEALKAASIVVIAKPVRGRWRAGRHFTRTEQVIPFGDLSEADIAALEGDAELVVSVRLSRHG